MSGDAFRLGVVLTRSCWDVTARAHPPVLRVVDRVFSLPSFVFSSVSGIVVMYNADGATGNVWGDEGTDLN